MRRVWMLALVALGSLGAGVGIAQTNDRGVTSGPAFSGVVPDIVIGTGTIASDVGSTSPLRVFRDGVPSACGTTKPFPGTFPGGPFTYQTVGYTNTGGPRCVIFTLTSSCTGGGNPSGTFLVAYNGAVDPNNLATNYVADSGSSTGATSPPVTLGVNLAQNQTITLMVEQVNPTSTAPASTCSYVLQDNTQIVVPTMSPPSMAAMAGILALLGFAFLRRRAGQR